MRPIQQYPKRSLVYVFCTLLMAGLLMSACSQSPSVNSSAGATPTIAGVPTKVARTNPIANQPPGTTKAVPGQNLSGNEIKTLTFNLSYNDTLMEQDLAQIYQPGSPTFHQFLTPPQIVQRYALNDTQLQQVQKWLGQNKYTIDSVDALRSAITVRGSVSTIERSLHIQLQRYSILNREIFMQNGAPVLPSAVAPLIHSIVGLDNFALPEIKPPINALQNTQDAAASSCSKYGAKQSLTRDKLAYAYQMNRLYQQNLQGQGMTVGVAEFDEPYDPADIANYAACAGIATPSIQNVQVDGPVKAGAGEGEAAMDIELIAGLAPKAQILVYQAGGTPFAQELVDLLNRVATDHRVQVLSMSYGTGEDQFSVSEQSAVNRGLRTLATEGISVFISSGDCGAYSQRVHNIAMVSFPASAPYAIAVGGTHLQVNGNNVSETTWGQDDGSPVCQNEWGTGGGVSQNTSFHRPAWQVGPGTTTSYDGSGSVVLTTGLAPVSAPNGLRQVPDVSAAAYPNIAIYYQGSWLQAGGTSAAAPIWAAGAILLDQGLQTHGKAYFGGVPGFYTLANHQQSAHPYTDITTGNNLFYPATRGWDYATGWGSPNFSNILQSQLAA